MEIPNYNFDELPHIMIVEAQNCPEISAAMTKAAQNFFTRMDVSFENFTVPRVQDIPQAIQYAVRGLDFYTARKRFDAYIAIGCVFGTDVSFIHEQTSSALLSLALEHTLAIGDGIVSCNYSADELSGAELKDNPGFCAAHSVLEMLRLKSHFGIYPRI